MWYKCATEKNHPMSFLKTPKLFSLHPYPWQPPSSHYPLSLSPFYSPCPNPLFMSLPLHLCGYMTHHTRLPFGFSVSFIPSLVSPSFFFSFSLFPTHTAVTYFIVMFHAPSWPPLHILPSALVGYQWTVVCCSIRCHINCEYLWNYWDGTWMSLNTWGVWVV